jgi:CHAT domain-containing protein/Tfp pilus assembly protein PilF
MLSKLNYSQMTLKKVPLSCWLPAAALAAALLACGQQGPDLPEGQKGERFAMSNPAPPVRLEPEQRQEGQLKEKETRSYLVRLEAGEYVRITAEQLGVDLTLRLLAPGGELIAEVDTPSPSGTKGFERVSEVAAVSGDYRVEVVGTTTPGRYEIQTETPRPATQADRLRVQGERTFLEGENLRRAHKNEEAIARYQKALDLWKKAGDALREQGAALYSIARMRERLDQWEKAAESCAQAVTLYSQAKELIGQAEALNCQGRMLNKLDRIREARPLLEEAVRLFREAGSPEGEASALNNLGNTYTWEGSFEAAVDTYTQALDLQRQLKNRPGEVTGQINLGNLYLDQGRLDVASEHFERALKSAEETGERGPSGEALESLARVAYQEGRISEARERCERALALYREIGSRWDQAMALNTLGLVLLKAGDRDGAQARHEEALTLFRAVGDAQGEAMVTALLGFVALAQRDGRKSLDLGRQALAQFEQLDNRRGITLAHYGIAQAYRQLEQPENALREIEVSVKLAESQRAATDSLDTRAFFFATRQHYWELYIDTLLALDRIHPKKGFDVRALEADEGRRARSLLDALAEARTAGQKNVNDALLRQEEEVRRLLGQARRPEEINDLLTRLDRVRTEIRKSSPRLARLAGTEPLKLEEIRNRLLDANTLLLVYALGEERSVLWAVTRSNLVAHTLPGRGQIEATAQSVHKVLSRRLQSGPALRQREVENLTALVLKPVEADLPYFRRLLIVTDGALQTVPFSALPDPGAAPEGGRQPLLVESHSIIYLPSASVGATLRRERQTGALDRPNPLIAILADPVFDATDPRVSRTGEAPQVEQKGADGHLGRSLRDLGVNRLEPLPSSRKEAEIIESLWPGEVQAVFGFDARREILSDARWRNAPVLHFATHSLFDERRPELSGLAFTQVNPDGTPRLNGFLRLHEIPSLDLKADLVVLSACETGAGKDLRGEGVFGITRGFMALGVPQLVASLWKVEDRATAELMTRFYRELHDGHRPPEALQRAQKAMLRDPEWSDPALWAGFIFLGDFERRPGGGIEVSDMGGTDTNRKAYGGGLPGKPRPKPVPPKPQTSPPDGMLPERYQFYSYTPDECAPNTWSTLLAYCSRDSALAAVLADSERRMAVEPTSYTRTHATPASPVSTGSQVVVIPELAGCRFNPPRASFLLLEDWQCAEFRFQPLRGLPGFALESHLLGRLSFYVRSILVADIPFRVRLAPALSGKPRMAKICRSESQPYPAVFVSYSRSDTAVVEVLERAYAALGMTALRDIHFLHPGEKWAPALLEKIEASDIFQLFWSARAKRSKWVKAEWQHALGLQRPFFIRPVYWEQPLPRPPRDLAGLHFHQLDLGGGA